MERGTKELKIPKARPARGGAKGASASGTSASTEMARKSKGRAREKKMRPEAKINSEKIRVEAAVPGSLPKVPPELPALISLFLGILVFLSLISYDASDLTLPQGSDHHNYAGYLGALISESLIKYFGLAAFFFVFVFVLMAFYTMTAFGRRIQRFQAALGLGLTAFSLLSFLSIAFPEGIPLLWRTGSGGGLLGRFLGEALVGLTGKVGSLILLPLLAFCGFLLFSGLSFRGVGGSLANFTLDA
ncbi:MAG: DNA translocase FtsK 4TM domain-containing protein, partial [Deltaproteobacteria bacterium]|nr:DNA translocase FtsK 4TM domain-containing protein [Deltaproteobacteria bacterium]